MKIFVTCQDQPTSQLVLKLGKKLGQGKFEVYQVYSSTHKSNFAFKIFPRTPLGTEHYERELLLSGLCHPNVIQYIPTQCASNDFYGLMTEFTKHGDLLNLITARGPFNSEVLVRTYFQHLIDGMEYIHSKGVAHLDLKLENLVLGNDFTLKIIDFDQAQPITDSQLISAGTPSCRAPEVIEENCQNLAAADVYSAGVILFALKAGQFPFIEKNCQEGTSLFPYSLFMRNNNKFWKEKVECLEEGEHFDRDFIELVNGMLEHNPEKRFTIQQIRDSKWYKGSTLCKESLKVEMKTRLSIYMKEKAKLEQIY